MIFLRRIFGSNIICFLYAVFHIWTLAEKRYFFPAEQISRFFNRSIKNRCRLSSIRFELKKSCLPFLWKCIYGIADTLILQNFIPNNQYSLPTNFSNQKMREHTFSNKHQTKDSILICIFSSFIQVIFYSPTAMYKKYLWKFEKCIKCE